MREAVAVVGSLALDTVARGARRERRLGGVVAYAGLTYRRLGLATHAVFNLAEADRRHLATLAAAGLDLVAGGSEATTECVNRLEEGGRTQEMPALARPIGADLVRPIGALVRLVQLGPLHPGDIELEVAHTLRREGVSVALDVQGLVRHVAPDGTVLRRLAAGTEAFLGAARFLKGDVDEVAALEQGLGRPLAALMEEHAIEETLVTDGARGGRLVVRGASPLDYRAAPRVEEPCDSTGAGDVLFAAYLAARLWEGAPPAEAAARAATVAARHVAGEWIRPASLALAPA